VAKRTSTILVRHIDDTDRYGRVLVDDDGYVIAFREKDAMAALPAARRPLINAGCYVLQRDIVLSKVASPPCSLETYVLPSLVAERELVAVCGEGYFIDIGLPACLDAARRELLAVRRRPAAFLDRDGVLNVDHGYTYRTEDLRLIDDAAAAVRRLNEAGFLTLVVSNQAGIARGYYTEDDARSFNQALRRRMMAAGARLDAVYFCPHHPEGVVPRYTTSCACRKPKPGLLRMAAHDWPIAARSSFLIGNAATDIEAARAFGVPGFKHSGGSLLTTVEFALETLRQVGQTA
jgi:D-glycero-D-manno-heptose 1,7-bisphosphate phosphatase